MPNTTRTGYRGGCRSARRCVLAVKSAKTASILVLGRYSRNVSAKSPCGAGSQLARPFLLRLRSRLRQEYSRHGRRDTEHQRHLHFAPSRRSPSRSVVPFAALDVRGRWTMPLRVTGRTPELGTKAMAAGMSQYETDAQVAFGS